MLLVKKYASCLFGTDLASRLVSHVIDTLMRLSLSSPREHEASGVVLRHPRGTT